MPMSGSHQNFSTIFTWAYINNYRVAQVNNHLVVKLNVDNNEGYYFPAGTGDVKPVLDEMIKDATDNNHDFYLYALSRENQQVMENLYPGQFNFEYERSFYDYVYDLNKLVTLSGKKLHSKRNHINAFMRDNKKWRFELITDENVEDCKKMNELWCKEAGCADDDGLKNDHCATRRYFKYRKELGVEGALIKIENDVVAFTIGEVLNSNTYVIHVEKSFRDVQGGYTMINREFAEYVQKTHPDIIWMNREEDMGEKGLRKAKESYYPDKMEEKCWAVMKK
ncbi:MAG TPA: hypothetical protein DDZ89_09490 [Clostridiales bacterium]|nr:hypothetical protein [Clostridiales bacterium]